MSKIERDIRLKIVVVRGELKTLLHDIDTALQTNDWIKFTETWTSVEEEFAKLKQLIEKSK